MTVRAAGATWLSAGVVYVLCETVAAQRYPGYDYARNYISALGVPDESPSAAVMNAGAFVLHGVLFAVAGLLVARTAAHGRRRTALVTMALTNGVGNVLVGLFHAGSSPLHGLGALLAIVGGNAAMIVACGLLGTLGAPQWFCVLGRAAGVVGIASFVALLMIAGHHTDLEGAVERGSVYTIIGWDLVAGVVLPTRGRSPQSVCG